MVAVSAGATIARSLSSGTSCNTKPASVAHGRQSINHIVCGLAVTVAGTAHQRLGQDGGGAQPRKSFRRW